MALICCGGFHKSGAEVTAGYGIGWVLGVVAWIDEVVFIKLMEPGCCVLRGYG